MIYTGALPQASDVAQPQRDAQAAIGRMAAALFASQTIVDGLSVNPTTPASLQVTVGIGTIFSMQSVDNTAFGALAADTSHQIMKLGALTDPQNLAITPPAQAGYSQVYLVQAQFQDQDGGSAVLPYYNSSNPSQAYSGPGNSGSAQFTRRFARTILSLKAGIAASTGSQANPSPDAGWIGLAYVTVANGATQIVAGNIATVPLVNGGARRLVPLTGLAPIDSPQFTGQPSAPTPNAGDNSSKVATTAFAAGAASAAVAGLSGQFQFSSNANGFWYKLPSGVIIQWGSAYAPATGVTTSSKGITLPLSYPNNAYYIQATPAGAANSPNGFIPSIYASSNGAGSFTVGVDTLTGNDTPQVPINQNVWFYWQTIGY